MYACWSSTLHGRIMKFHVELHPKLRFQMLLKSLNIAKLLISVVSICNAPVIRHYRNVMENLICDIAYITSSFIP